MPTDSLAERLRNRMREIPDFPQRGIVFKDITPVLADHALFADVIHALAEPWQSAAPDKVAGIESRGFIFAAPVAMQLGCGFVPIRKPGKLPYQTEKIEYALEYGFDALEVHVDAFAPGERVLIVDDVLATGGTAAAAVRLVEKLGAKVVGCSFVIELAALRGREQFGGLGVQSLLT